MLVVLLGACTQPASPTADPNTPTSSAPQPSVNALHTNEGLMIFGKNADEYLSDAVSDEFSVASSKDFVRTGTIMKKPESGKCFDTIAPYGSIDASTSMAVLAPAQIRCEYDGGEEMPTSTLTGLVKNGVFTPFSSTAHFVPSDTPRQTYDMATDGQNVYWFETASTSLSHDEWRLFAADIETGKSKLLLTAEEGLQLAGPLPVAAKTNLTYREGRLYFGGFFPTEQYYAKVEAQQIDPEGWAPEDFTLGVLSVNTDGTDLAVAGESISSFGFTEEHIAYVKLAPGTLSFLTPEGTREDTPEDVPRYIALAAEGTEEKIVEDLGSSDGMIHSENKLANFRVQGNIVTFTRGLTLYVLDVVSRDVEIVDLMNPIEAAAENAPIAESRAKIEELIYLKGRAVVSVSLDSVEDSEFMLVVYDTNTRTGTTYRSEAKPYKLRDDQGKIAFHIENGDIDTYSLPD